MLLHKLLVIYTNMIRNIIDELSKILKQNKISTDYEIFKNSETNVRYWNYNRDYMILAYDYIVNIFN